MSRTTVADGLVRVLRHTALLIALVGGSACALTGRAAAQTAPVPANGTRVRVVLPAADSQPEPHVVGRLVRFQRDTVVLWTGGTFDAPVLQTIALDGGRRLQISTRHSQAAAGFLLGMGVGGLAGAAIGTSMHQECTSCYVDLGPAVSGLAGGLLGGLVGGLLGAAIGSSIRSETWTPAATSTVGLAVAPGVARLSVAF